MQWARRNNKISPIPTHVETALLYKALERQPNNDLAFSKLVELLIFQNSLEAAVELCQSYDAENAQAIAVQVKVFTKAKNYESLIRLTENKYSIDNYINIAPYLVNAYLKLGEANKARKTAAVYLTSNIDYSKISVESLRLIFSTLVTLGELNLVHDTYLALPGYLQLDSHITLEYLRVQYKLGHRDEVKRLIDYSSMVAIYHISDFYDLNDTLLNKQLENYILPHKKLQFEPGNHATRQGSRLLFESSWDSSLETIEGMIKAGLEKYLSESNTKLDFALELNMWATVMERNGHQIPHVHPEGILSGIYYPNSLPDKLSSKPENSEEIPSKDLLGKDRPSKGLPGSLAFHQNEITETYQITPKAGMLVIFPSYFYHHTVPTDTDVPRVSIAFDMIRSVQG